MQAGENQTRGELQSSTYKPKNILCYGHDTILLHSRERILRLAGCYSGVVETESEFCNQLGLGCPGVIVLCQTLQLEEGVRACEFAQEHCPGASLLVFYIQRQRFTPVQEHIFSRRARAHACLPLPCFACFTTADKPVRQGKSGTRIAFAMSGSDHSGVHGDVLLTLGFNGRWVKL